jgi:hypothetical protein
MVAAAAAVTAMLAAGGTTAAMAATAGTAPAATASPTPPVKSPPARAVPVPGGDLAAQAARLGVTPARLQQALRTVKVSLGATGTPPTPAQFEAALATVLGIPVARVQQAFPAGVPAGTKPVNGGQPGAPSSANPDNEPLAAAIARELHVSVSRVSAALRPLFAAGRADPSSPAFAAAARALGVSPQQLATAIMQAKQSLAATQPHPQVKQS